jgi:hypothetical protein
MSNHVFCNRNCIELLSRSFPAISLVLQRKDARIRLTSFQFSPTISSPYLYCAHIAHKGGFFSEGVDEFVISSNRQTSLIS